MEVRSGMKILQKTRRRLARLLDRIVKFFRFIGYINRKYYSGHIRWIIQDKKGTCVYCNDCGNIANGVYTRKIHGLTFNIPMCKSHLSVLYFKKYPEAESMQVPLILSET